MPIHNLGRLMEGWRELEDAGIPLEPPTLRVGAKPNAGLTIRQMPTGYNEAVIREIDGRVGYVLPVFIRRDEPGKTIIRDWTLHVPWDGCVEWLDEDKKRNRGWYTFSRDGVLNHQYARNSVLNHRMERILYRGDICEGLLLAVGKVRPPETYRNGEMIPIRFSILDQWDCEASVTFKLSLARGHYDQIPKSTRGPLLSKRDSIEVCEPREPSTPLTGEEFFQVVEECREAVAARGRARAAGQKEDESLQDGIPSRDSRR